MRVRNRSPRQCKVTWEGAPTPEAEARLEAAFRLLFDQALPSAADLTEPEGGFIMSHAKPKPDA